MMQYGWNDGGWGIFWMLVSMVAMVGILLAIVFTLVRSSSNDRPQHRDPKGVLAERFAKGEMDADEYRERQQVLDATAHAEGG